MAGESEIVDQRSDQFETLIYEKMYGVGMVVLNRPLMINAYSVQMRDDMFEVLSAVRDDPDVRVMLLSGDGERGFCAGADLDEFGSAPSQIIARQVMKTRDVWGLFLSISKPIIVALHGYVLGSGMEMALLCDIRVASHDAVFGMPEVALGMIPAAGGTQTISRAIGSGRVLELLLTNQRIDAEEALRIGVVHKIVPRVQLIDKATEMARRLASFDTDALAASKEAVRRGLELPMMEALKLEERLTVDLLSKRII